MKTDIYTTDIIIQKIKNSNPLYIIKEAEFDKILLQFGSLLSIIQNKRINQTMLLVTLLESHKYREIFKTMSGIDDISVLFYNIIVRYPILCTSKIIRNKIEELNGN